MFPLFQKIYIPPQMGGKKLNKKDLYNKKKGNIVSYFLRITSVISTENDIGTKIWDWSLKIVTKFFNKVTIKGSLITLKYQPGVSRSFNHISTVCTTYPDEQKN